MKQACLLLLACIVGASSAGAADKACVISGRGHFRIYVDSAGLFGIFGHNHVIEAQEVDGCAMIDSNDFTRSSVILTFPTAALRVLDPKTNEEDRAKVQNTMETEVLHVLEYPEIRFESTAIQKGSAESALIVLGDLTIRDKTQRVILRLALMHLTDGTYRAVGEYKLKQTAFGIAPIRLVGGTVKVKDELRMEFELFLK